MEFFNRLWTSSLNFLAVRCKKATDEDYKEIVDISQRALRRMCITDPHSISDSLEMCGNLFLLHDPDSVLAQYDDYEDVIYLHYDLDLQELVSVIPSKMKKAKFCVYLGCDGLPGRNAIYCQTHHDLMMHPSCLTVTADNTSDMVWGYFLRTIEQQDKLQSVQFGLSNEGSSDFYEKRKSALASAINLIIYDGQSGNESAGVDNLSGHQIEVLHASLKLHCFVRPFVTLAWDPYDKIPIYRFIDEVEWHAFCRGDTNKANKDKETNKDPNTDTSKAKKIKKCFKPVLPNSAYCSTHSPTKSESPVRGKILQLCEVEYIYQLVEEDFEVCKNNIEKCGGEVSIQNGEFVIRLSEDNTRIQVDFNFEKKETKTLCPNFFTGLECTKLFKHKCPDCDNDLGWTVFLAEALHASLKLPTFLVEMRKNSARDVTQLITATCKNRFKQFQLPEDTQLEVKIQLHAKTKQDVFQVKTALTLYAHFEGYLAETTIRVCVAQFQLGSGSWVRVNALLNEIGVELVAALPQYLLPELPLEANGKPSFVFCKLGDEIDRGTTAAMIYRISAPHFLHVYCGIDNLLRRTGRVVEVTHHATVKSDKTMAKLLPITGRKILPFLAIPCSETSAAPSNYGVETLVFAAYKSAEEILNYSQEILVNKNSSSYHWKWWWFIELQHFQKKEFNTFIRCASLRDQTVWTRKRLRLLK